MTLLETLPDVVGRCAALRPSLSPGQAFSGVTAAQLHGMPLPSSLSGDRRIRVSSPLGGRLCRHPGVIATTRSAGRPADRDGLLVLTPDQTFVELGAELTVADLTAIGDWLVTGSPGVAPVTSREALRSTARFIPADAVVHEALRRVRVGSWSRPETLLRLLLEDTGVPPPVLNEAVALPGGWRARPDLAWPDLRVAVEYDGAQHAMTGAADAERDLRMADAGWLVVHVAARELFHLPQIAVGRVHHALRARGRPTASLNLIALPRYAV